MAGPSGPAFLYNFYPRSPCGERRLTIMLYDTSSVIFLSTLSLRRATLWVWTGGLSFDISIHALLAESDLHCKTLNTFLHYFYPRSPCGERPSKTLQNWRKPHISIHALLAESDFASAGRFQIVYNFYPRSPCGERLIQPIRKPGNALFLSTLSLRRATTHPIGVFVAVIISIHALLAESDRG